MQDPDKAIRFKVCGLTRPQDIAAVMAAGAHYAGFVFFPKSPRHLTLPQARALASECAPGLCTVALTVNADNAALDALTDQVPLDMLQLHGSEPPERVAEVKARYGLPVMKAFGVAEASDLAPLKAYAHCADQLLVDAKPPKGADLPGGNGLAFDWRILDGVRWPVPWMLAGGLTPDNVAEAVARTKARQVDVSSGVEVGAGVKDAGRIIAFSKALKAPAAPLLS